MANNLIKTQTTKADVINKSTSSSSMVSATITNVGGKWFYQRCAVSYTADIFYFLGNFFV